MTRTCFDFQEASELFGCEAIEDRMTKSSGKGRKWPSGRLDNTAPEHRITVVEDSRLSWTDGSLRVVKSDAEAGWAKWRNCRGCRGCRIAEFDVDLSFTLGESWIEEIEIRHRALILAEGFFWAE